MLVFMWPNPESDCMGRLYTVERNKLFCGAQTDPSLFLVITVTVGAILRAAIVDNGFVALDTDARTVTVKPLLAFASAKKSFVFASCYSLAADAAGLFRIRSLWPSLLLRRHTDSLSVSLSFLRRCWYTMLLSNLKASIATSIMFQHSYFGLLRTAEAAWFFQSSSSLHTQAVDEFRN